MLPGHRKVSKHKLACSAAGILKNVNISWPLYAGATLLLTGWNRPMDKNAFHPDTRYTITWQDPEGRVQAANIYVFRVHDDFMVTRLTGADGLLRKISFAEVLKIVKEEPVAPQARLFVPAALLDAKVWRDRVTMQHTGGSPQRGK
jgi:hypothetical protein